MRHGRRKKRGEDGPVPYGCRVALREPHEGEPPARDAFDRLCQELLAVNDKEYDLSQSPYLCGDYQLCRGGEVLACVPADNFRAWRQALRLAARENRFVAVKSGTTWLAVVDGSRADRRPNVLWEWTAARQTPPSELAENCKIRLGLSSRRTKARVKERQTSGAQAAAPGGPQG